MTKVTFTGAAILLRNKAAYQQTSIRLTEIERSGLDRDPDLLRNRDEDLLELRSNDSLDGLLHAEARLHLSASDEGVPGFGIILPRVVSEAAMPNEYAECSGFGRL